MLKRSAGSSPKGPRNRRSLECHLRKRGTYPETVGPD